MSADQELHLLEKAIAQLPITLKEPLLLTVFQGLSHEQAGAQLGLSAKAIEGRTRRARQALERQINAWINIE
jgi:RNA polymerase sigma factor CnrH